VDGYYFVLCLQARININNDGKMYEFFVQHEKLLIGVGIHDLH